MINENRKFKNLGDNKKLYYIIGGSTLGLILIISILVIALRSNEDEYEVIDIEKLGQENNIITEEASTSMDKTVNEVENENTVNKVAINTSTMNTTNTSSSSKSKKTTSYKSNTTTETDSKPEEKLEISFIRPVNGDIIKDYSKDNLIFSETLNEWTTHNGIDLRAEKTEIVKAAAAGTVTAIKNDPRYGLSITIEHEDGYKTIYSNLLTSEFVVEGEKVEQGQTIATVGNTAVFESAEDIHVHFELLKDNENIDPTTYLK